jgi:hypothetical protein
VKLFTAVIIVVALLADVYLIDYNFCTRAMLVIDANTRVELFLIVSINKTVPKS